MRYGGNDKIVDTHTRATIVTREREKRERLRRERAKSESRERMNIVSLRSFHMKKLLLQRVSKEINGVVVYFRKKRTATAIN